MNRVFAIKTALTAAVGEVTQNIATKSPLAIRHSLPQGSDEFQPRPSVVDGLNFIATWNVALLLSVDLNE